MLGRVAEDMGQTLILHPATSPVQMPGDKNLLTKAVISLIDNALLHCPEPARVEISLCKVRDQALITIDGNGQREYRRPSVPR